MKVNTEEQFLFLKDTLKLMNEMITEGFRFTYGETWRPQEMQNIYLAKGLTTRKHSRHTDRMAIDLNLFIGDDYLFDDEGEYVKEDKKRVRTLMHHVAEYWKSLNPKNTWGGSWDRPFDPGHFQRDD